MTWSLVVVRISEISTLKKKKVNDNPFIHRTFSLGFMGSPSVASERFQDGEQLRKGGVELGKYCGIEKFSATLW